MKELSIKRALDESTRRQGILIHDEVYSLHITHSGEVIITDFSDYEKIYSVQSADFFSQLKVGVNYATHPAGMRQEKEVL